VSGGSLDYVYQRVEDAAQSIALRGDTPLQRAFAGHLTRVAEALYALEWAWSGDSDIALADHAMRKLVSPAEELDAATARANLALEELQDCLRRAKP
jgi:hypothetical protein